MNLNIIIPKNTSKMPKVNKINNRLPTIIRRNSKIHFCAICSLKIHPGFGYICKYKNNSRGFVSIHTVCYNQIKLKLEVSNGKNQRSR